MGPSGDWTRDSKTSLNRPSRCSDGGRTRRPDVVLESSVDVSKFGLETEMIDTTEPGQEGGETRSHMSRRLFPFVTVGECPDTTPDSL